MTDDQRSGPETTPDASGPTDVQNPGEEARNETGIQTRIDELTAKYRQAEERSAQYEALVAQMSGQLITMNQQLTELKTPKETPPEIDGEQAKTIETVVNHALGQRLAKLEAQVTAIGGRMGNRDVERVATIVGRPDLVPKVSSQLETLRGRGYPMDANDVLAWQLGQELIATRTKAAQAAVERARATGGIPVLPGAAPPPNLAPLEVPDYPKDFDRWDPGRQADWIQTNRLRGQWDGQAAP